MCPKPYLLAQYISGNIQRIAKCGSLWGGEPCDWSEEREGDVSNMAFYNI